MCSQITCNLCSKATWSGCGNHIEEALAGVLEQDRCQGHHNDRVKRGFFSKIFGKKGIPNPFFMRNHIIHDSNNFCYLVTSCNSTYSP